MKKLFLLSFVLLFAIYLMTAKPSFACFNCWDIPNTIITGKVKDANNKPVVDAQVEVACNHLGSINKKTTATYMMGYYLALFPSSKCDNGDTVTVTATKNSLHGLNTGIVKEKKCAMDIAIINVILVPEFGLITGALAALGSTGAFLFLKKKNS